MSEMRRFYDEATQGEWFYDESNSGTMPGVRVGNRILADCESGYPDDKENARLIVAMHRSFPHMLNHTQRAFEKLQELIQHLESDLQIEYAQKARSIRDTLIGIEG